MAKYKKKSYYRRYGYRRYKKIARFEYLRAKLEFTDVVSWPTDSVGAGHPLFNTKRDQGLQILDANTVLTGTQNFAPLVNMFAYYKIYAFSYDIIPCPSNTNGNITITNIYPVYLLFEPSLGVNVPSLQVVRANNNVVMLDPNVRQRKFVRLLGGTNSYMLSGTAPSGALTVVAQGTGTINDSPSWQVKLTFYVIFKKTKI